MNPKFNLGNVFEQTFGLSGIPTAFKGWIFGTSAFSNRSKKGEKLHHFNRTLLILAGPSNPFNKISRRQSPKTPEATQK